MFIRGAIQAVIGLGAVASVALVAPAVPTILSPKSGLVTQEAWLTVSGQGTPLAPILLYDGDQYIARSEVGRDGKWMIEASFMTGKHEVKAMYEQADGKVTAASKPVLIEVKDLLAPLAEGLRISNATEGQTVRAGAFKLEGSAAPGRRLQVNVDGGKPFFKTAEEDGNWSFNIYLAKGKHTIVISTAVEPRESQSLTLIAR